MKSFRKKIFSLTLVLAILMAIFIPTIVNATETVTYTITYDVNGGKTSEKYPIVPLTVTAGSTFTLPKFPELPELISVENGSYITVNYPEGKVFDAFEINGERKNPGDNIEVNDNTVIKYLWKDLIYIDKIEVSIEAPIVGTYVELKSEYNEELDYTYTTQINSPVVTIPSDANYTFFYKDSVGTWVTEDYDLFEGEIKANTSYIACITFCTKDVDNYSFSDGVKVIVNGIEAKNVERYDTGVFNTVYFPINSVEDNITYTIDYDVNGGSIINGPLVTQTVSEGEKFTLPSIPELPELLLGDKGYRKGVHSPEGKTFDAFEINGERYNPGDKIEINENTIIKYLWKDIIYIHKIEATIEAPKAGITIDGEYNETFNNYEITSLSSHPNAFVSEGVHYGTDNEFNYWAKEDDKVYIGEIKKDTIYNALVTFYGDKGYLFADDIQVIINGEEAEIDGSLDGYFVSVKYPIKSVNEEDIINENEVIEEAEEIVTNEEEKTQALNNPKTGDNIAVWMSLMLVSIIGASGTIKLVKKNK